MLNQQLIQNEFPQDDEVIYLNHAAVSPWPARSAAQVNRFADENIRTGAFYYKSWVMKENELREQLKTLINAASVNEIALLKNTSEAISVVASGLDWTAGDNVVSTDEEFPSNRMPWEAQKSRGIELREIGIRNDNPEQALIDACDANTRIMSVSSVQYVSGIRLQLDTLGSFCRQNNILFCVDAIQSIGAHSFDVQACYIDFAMADAHKWMLGPEGIALFYCREDLLDKLNLYQFGWHMMKNAGNYDVKTWEAADTAKRFECGSPNMLGTHTLSASLSLVLEVGIENIERAINDNVEHMIERLTKINGLTLLSPANAGRRAGIVSFKVEGHDASELHAQLMENKVVCACRGGAVRFSPHFYTSRQKIDRALDILTSLI